ncbi:DNA polymerase [Paenibacillus terrigena]|uniref:DNA polymerase n=1 Tax=Paenibacillus terrigena TaxID=369333 RepID=UPI000373450C|nr:DNA polymerase [Paenibacillus terrigena]
MDVKLSLNIRPLTVKDDSATERVKAAVQRKAVSQPETSKEAFERIGGMALSLTERTQFEAAKSAFESGKIGSFRSDGAKWTKGDVLSAGAKVLREKADMLRQQRIRETLSDKPDNFRIITSDEDLPRMIERLREEVRLQQNDDWFRQVFGLFNNTLIRRKLAERGIDIPAAVSLTVWDTETSGLDKMIDLSGGYSLWLPLLNEGYYVAYGHLTDEKQCTRSKALGAVSQFMALPAHIKSFHNAEYDLAIMLNDGFEPQGIRYDSVAAQRTLNDNEETYALKPLIAKYKTVIGVDCPDYTFEDLFANESPMLHPIEVVGIYAIWDVLKGWWLTRWQIDNLVKTDKLAVAFFEINQYLSEVNVNIERTGFVIDIDGLKALGDELRPRLEQAQADVAEAYGVTDPEFIRKMDRTINATKITAWCDAQRKRVERNQEAQKKQREIIAECEATGKTTLKRYTNAVARLTELVAEGLTPATEEHAPLFITEFSFTNDNHLRYLIYDHLGIEDRTKQIVKDKSKTRAVSKDVLDRYFGEEEALKPLANVSAFEKLLGTYIDKIPNALDVDGRLHTQLDTVSTGRYSSKGYLGKPNELRADNISDANYLAVMRRLVDCPEKSVAKGTNIQNIPARTKEGERVRNMFVPPPGYIFLGSDLSSIEPRLQAHKMAIEHGDEIFAEMYRKGLDPYVEFAAIMFEVDRELCFESAYKAGLTSIPFRKLTKDMFLAKGYGQAEDQFVKTAVKRGITEVSGKRAYAKFDEILPGFSTMVNASFEHLREHGWTATLWGQKRRFPDYRKNWQRLCTLMKRAGIRDKNDPELGKKSRRLTHDLRSEFWQLIRLTGRDERAAFNHEIQGSGANVLKLCMIRSYYELTLARGWEFTLTLHDEQKHAAPAEQVTQKMVDLYTDIMTNTATFACPLDCDTVLETHWMREYKASEWDFESGRPLPEFADKYSS